MSILSTVKPSATITNAQVKYLQRRVRACDYISVAELFLQSNFLLKTPLCAEDIKPRLLGHWGTCHGINVAYANLKHFFAPNLSPTKGGSSTGHHHNSDSYHFILGPGHGFPALQANLFLDGDLSKIDPKATLDLAGLEYVCRNFSWPGGFPSHASPMTPGVICEGGELGYALGAAYGYALGHPHRTIAVMLGDGELETASALASLNLIKLLGDHQSNGRVIPILHLNGYKISAPTIYGRKSERELNQLIRGFGYTPLLIADDQPDTFQSVLQSTLAVSHPFLILRTKKGATGPEYLNSQKIAGNYLAHQIPLPNAKTDPAELAELQNWLESYHFNELFDAQKGFTL